MLYLCLLSNYYEYDVLDLKINSEKYNNIKQIENIVWILDILVFER